jgi:uncharacterized membrane protein YdjX (TVP38/TMEM64 family)
MYRVRRALFLQLAGGVAAVLFVVWLSRHYPLLAWITQAQEHITAMGRWGGVLYPLLYAACNVLLLPAGTLAIGSGLFFGLWWGFLLNVAASVLGAAGAFSISRWAAREWVRRHFLRHRKWAALDEAVAREGWKIIFLTQVHPLAPSSLLNYLYGAGAARPPDAARPVAPAADRVHPVDRRAAPRGRGHDAPQPLGLATARGGGGKIPPRAGRHAHGETRRAPPGRNFS